MFSPALRLDFQSGPSIGTLATRGVSSAPRVGGLPFTTPEEMYAAQRRGLPRFDVDAMTRAGKMLRTHNHTVTSAGAIGFVMPHGKVNARQLVAALQRIDVHNVVRMGIQPTAVFDFDNTVIGGDVFTDFVKLLIQRNDLPNANAARCAKLFVDLAEGKVDPQTLRGESTNAIVARAMAMVDADKLSLSNAFFLVIAALTGVAESRVTAVAEELFTKGFAGKPPYRFKFFGHGRYNASAEAVVKTLHARGVAAHIITLGLPTVARVGAKLLGIPPHHVHGFELEVVGGIITGRAVDARVLGKHTVCERLVGKRPLFAFGDSPGSDTPVLALAQTRAFAVEPSLDFQAHIKKNNSDLTWLTYKS